MDKEIINLSVSNPYKSVKVKNLEGPALGTHFGSMHALSKKVLK